MYIVIKIFRYKKIVFFFRVIYMYCFYLILFVVNDVIIIFINDFRILKEILFFLLVWKIYFGLN